MMILPAPMQRPSSPFNAMKVTKNRNMTMTTGSPVRRKDVVGGSPKRQTRRSSSLRRRAEMSLPHKRKHSASTKKSISFSPSVLVRPSLHINEYSDEEYFACWYTSNELDTFRIETRRVARLLEQGQKPVPTRGAGAGTGLGGHAARSRRSEMFQLVSAPQTESFIQGMTCCSRGLEQFTMSGSERRRKNRGNVHYVVLGAQRRQREQKKIPNRICHIDDEMIAELSRLTTRNCQVQAHLLGLADWQAATESQSSFCHCPCD